MCKLTYTTRRNCWCERIASTLCIGKTHTERDDRCKILHFCCWEQCLLMRSLWSGHDEVLNARGLQLEIMLLLCCSSEAHEPGEAPAGKREDRLIDSWSSRDRNWWTCCLKLGATCMPKRSAPWGSCKIASLHRHLFWRLTPMITRNTHLDCVRSTPRRKIDLVDVSGCGVDGGWSTSMDALSRSKWRRFLTGDTVRVPNEGIYIVEPIKLLNLKVQRERNRE